MVHHGSWKPIYFGVKKSKIKVTRHKNITGLGFLHSCECWLLLVLLSDGVVPIDAHFAFTESFLKTICERPCIGLGLLAKIRVLCLIFY